MNDSAGINYHLTLNDRIPGLHHKKVKSLREVLQQALKSVGQ
jgi:hypothetical protein